MADTTISALPSAGVLTGTEVVPLVQNGANVQSPLSALAVAGAYRASFANAVIRTVGTKLAESVSVLDFGADNTGATDSTIAMSAAHATGKLIYYPAGTYKCTSGITIPGGGITGDGAYLTFINTTDTTSASIFNYTGANAGLFENFQLQTNTGPGQKSGGYGIVIGPVSGEVSGMRIWQIIMNNIPGCISFVRASLWSINSCNFYNFTGNGFLIDNQNNGDSGDSAIQGCIWTSLGNASAIAIQQVSSGGIKIVDNKFNNLQVGYLLNLGPVVGGVSTSDLVINGNSFENCSASAIQMQRASGTATFANVNIGDNQFLVSSAAGTGIYSNDSSGFLSTVNITGNVFVVTGTTGATGVLLDYVTNFMVGDNTMQGSGGTSTGILCGIHSVAGRIGVNQIRGFQFSVNGSTGLSIQKSDVQSGTVVITTSTGYGTLFAGTATVTYPTAFEADVPLIITDAQVYPANTANGGISAYATSISNTQVAIEAIGITSGGTVTVNWRVAGLL